MTGADDVTARNSAQTIKTNTEKYIHKRKARNTPYVPKNAVNLPT